MLYSTSMNPLRTVLITAMLCFVSEATAAPQEDASATNWILSSAYPVGNFHTENLNAFAKDLAETTGGKLIIKVHPNASLFPPVAIKSAWSEPRGSSSNEQSPGGI